MIEMGKKGIAHTKRIMKAMIGIRELDSGDLVCIQLDDFEILMSPEKAESLSAQLTAKVRKIRDNKEKAELQKQIEEEKKKLQKELPLPEPK